jgi:hypothetical protein
MARSVARVYQAVCWGCLGSPEDVRRRIGEAITDARDALFQVAVDYSQPLRAAGAQGQSWLERYRPSTALTRPSARRKLEADGRLGALERIFGSSVIWPSMRLQGLVGTQLDDANAWMRSVSEFGDRIRSSSEASTVDAAVCSVYSVAVFRGSGKRPPEQNLSRRADLKVSLRPGAALTVQGVSVRFDEMAWRTIAGTTCSDVRQTVSLSGHAGQWCVTNQRDCMPLDTGGGWLTPSWHPPDLDGLPEPRLTGNSHWNYIVGGNGVRLGPGFGDEVTG